MEYHDLFLDLDLEAVTFQSFSWAMPLSNVEVFQGHCLPITF